MSNMTTAQAYDESIYKLLEKPQVAYRDELHEWAQLGEQELMQRLKAMFTVWFPFPRLTADQISTIKGLLYPELIVKEVPATKDSVPAAMALPAGSSSLITLDVDQERMARTMKDGHRLFSGVAGSGKTLILLARAKALANRLPAQRVLLLCFNITLASHLRSLLHNEDQNPQYRERIEVRHFHDWARSLLGRLPNFREFNDSEAYDEFLGERVLAALNTRSLDQKWDAVLVDEAHTFSPKWFLCCVAALKEPQDGNLLVVSDGSQSLYKRRQFTWKSIGIQAQGRSKKFTQNYRNTQEILTAAWKVVQPTATHAASQGEVTFPAVAPAAALRHGSKPVLHLTQSRKHAVAAVVDQVKQLAQSGYAPGEIAILYRWLAKKDEAFFEDLRRQLDDQGLRTYWVTENDQTKLNYNVKIPGVRIITALSSLGLEFKVVLLLWVDQFASCCDHDLEEAAFARRQLYVAMTRAQDELHLFGHGNVALLDELQQSQSFEVVRARAASFGGEPIHEPKSARGHEQTLPVKFRKRHEPAL